MPKITGYYRGMSEVPSVPTIFTRYEKGQALTHPEMDTNLTSLLHTCSVDLGKGIKDAQYVTFQYASQSLQDGLEPEFCREGIKIQTMPSAKDVREKLADEKIPGSLGIQKDLSVENNVNVSGSLTVKNTTEFSGSVWIHGNLYVNDRLFEQDKPLFTSATHSDCVFQSDIRLKTNVQILTGSLDKVRSIDPVSFEWKEEAEESGQGVGVIAQQIQEIYPTAVRLGEDDYLKVNYARLVPLLIGAVKELSEEVISLRKQIEH